MKLSDQDKMERPKAQVARARGPVRFLLRVNNDRHPSREPSIGLEKTDGSYNRDGRPMERVSMKKYRSPRACEKSGGVRGLFFLDLGVR